VILNGLFSWLVHAGYLAGNPLALSRQRRLRAAPRIIRYLDDEVWQQVKEAIEAMPQANEREQAHYRRVRWLFSLLYLCGLRISEVVQNTMGGFFCRRDGNGEERWWLEITGKGGKTRIVPATDELMAELARYRRALKLPALPLQGETAPLLFPIGGRPIPMTRGAVHAIVKQVFANAAVRLRQRGAEFAVTAMRLEQASAHWLRHTAGSHMANNAVDLRHVRDNLGHESLSTTSGYLHSSDDLRQFRCKRSDSRPAVTNVSSKCMSRAFHPVCEVCAESVTPVSFFMHTKGTRK
jgi:site-specific recombinase XerD